MPIEETDQKNEAKPTFQGAELQGMELAYLIPWLAVYSNRFEFTRVKHAPEPVFFLPILLPPGSAVQHVL